MAVPPGRASECWRVLAVAVLAVLAGCGGFTPGNDTASTPTVTPAPVPDLDLPEAEGVESDAIDASRIAKNHRETLEGTNYTITETLRIGPADNASYRQETQVFLGSGDTPMRIDDEVTASRQGFLGRGTDAWWNGERAFYRYTFAGGQHSYYYVDQRPTGHLRIERRPIIEYESKAKRTTPNVARAAERVLEETVVRTVESGPGDATKVAGAIEDPRGLPTMKELTDIENATVTVLIEDNGIVSRMAVGYDANYYNQGRQHVRYTYKITDIGSTTVEQPAWLEELNEARQDG